MLLFMVIHYPKYTHRNLNESPRLIFMGACIRKDMWVGLQGAYIRRVYIRGGLIFGILRYVKL